MYRRDCKRVPFLSSGSVLSRALGGVAETNHPCLLPQSIEIQIECLQLREISHGFRNIAEKCWSAHGQQGEDTARRGASVGGTNSRTPAVPCAPVVSPLIYVSQRHRLATCWPGDCHMTSSAKASSRLRDVFAFSWQWGSSHEAGRVLWPNSG